MDSDRSWHDHVDPGGNFMVTSKQVAIIGGGPAGLMAAQALSESGHGISVLDAMPSFGRKFLMAGKSGLNITHAEDLDVFLSRYASSHDRLNDLVSVFGPRQITDWMQELGIDWFTGSTGRIFPVGMKASPLLRSWLIRLQDAGVQLSIENTGGKVGILMVLYRLKRSMERFQ